MWISLKGVLLHSLNHPGIEPWAPHMASTPTDNHRVLVKPTKLMVSRRQWTLACPLVQPNEYGRHLTPNVKAFVSPGKHDITRNKQTNNHQWLLRTTGRTSTNAQLLRDRTQRQCYSFCCRWNWPVIHDRSITFQPAFQLVVGPHLFWFGVESASDFGSGELEIFTMS